MKHWFAITLFWLTNWAIHVTFVHREIAGVGNLFCFNQCLIKIPLSKKHLHIGKLLYSLGCE